MKKQLLFITAFLSFMAISFAQSIDCKKTCIVDKLVHEGTYLGVQFGSPCDKETKTDKGVIILKVVENTAAADNDFKIFDVVLKINNTEVNNRGPVIKLITSYNPFDTVEFTILREGRTITKEVVLGARTTKVVQEEVCCEETESLLNENNVSIFPSPAVENLNISFKSVIQDDYTFGIYMANGVLVKEYTKKLDSGSLKETIPVNNLDDGVYVIKIKNQETTFSKLFVVGRK
ncbi:PDZ domain-containing protein [Lacinutrix sp.]|uniref:PDZ domain-containing protein n=1 Tax=Lacinutrix sp. TaxID=1937692 RepID=UPI0025C42ED7|nr:PDZ domain-containing protein [Lacinutrix sp.]